MVGLLPLLPAVVGPAPGDRAGRSPSASTSPVPRERGRHGRRVRLGGSVVDEPGAADDPQPAAPAGSSGPRARCRRGRVPLAVRAAGPVAPAPRRSRSSSRSRASRRPSTTSPASRRPASSAATPTGADRSGSRVNYLFIESLLRWDDCFGETFRVEYPTGSGALRLTRRRPRPARPSRVDLAARRRRAPTGYGPTSACDRPGVAATCSVPRVLPRRHGRRHRRLAPDRLDRAGRPPAVSGRNARPEPIRGARRGRWRRLGRRPRRAGALMATPAADMLSRLTDGARRARRELARCVDPALEDALPAPVVLGLGVHRHRPLVVRRGPRPAGASVPVPGPMVGRQGASHRVQPGGRRGRLLPGPTFWQSSRRSSAAPRDVETSGITQPPIHARAALEMHRHARDVEASRPS